MNTEIDFSCCNCSSCSYLPLKISLLKIENFNVSEANVRFHQSYLNKIICVTLSHTVEG